MNVLADKITRDYFRQTKESNVFTALKETELMLTPGKMTAVMGRSGSGKSTLLHIMAGLLFPTSGRVTYDETDIYSLDDEALSRFRNEHIGVIPQIHTGLHSLNVRENVMLPYSMYNKKCPDGRAEELMERVGISHLSEAYPDELSGGEMRRLSIARALIRSPQVLFADEPTGDLDDENTGRVMALLREAADGGTAVMLVTHESEAAGYADELYRMDGGILQKNE
ncbi:MAG: ABC transporter ATP-binding protein [Oscillospiraceae bacterium]|nr:ABC transporter ATP-binding protein [Oscillospiraceae bacterium]